MFEKDQAFEFPFGEIHTFMVEVEKHTIIKPTNGGVHASNCLVDERCRGLVHSSSPHNFILAMPFWNEYMVKVFSLLVSHEE